MHYHLLSPILAVGIAHASPEPAVPVFLRAPTDAMAPDISSGSILVQEPLSVAPNLGEIVLVREPQLKRTLLALRVVALPGSEISSTSETLLVNGRPLVAPPNSLNSPPLPWPGLEVDQTHPGSYRVPIGTYLILANNPADSADSRIFGVVPEALILGRIYKWTDVAKDPGRARPYLERNIAALRPRLPMNMQNGLTLDSVFLTTEGEVSLSIRVDGNYLGPLPISQTTAEDLRSELLLFYCQSTFGQFAQGVHVRYRVSDGNKLLTEIPVSASECPRR
jgi:signal peptidase I